MKDQSARSQGFNVLLTLASFVVVVAGMRAAASILVPFLLSVFIAIVTGPALFAMTKRGVPTSVGLLLVILVVVLVGVLVIAMVGNSINDFTRSMPAYQERLKIEGTRVIGWLNLWLSRFEMEIPLSHPAPEGEPSHSGPVWIAPTDLAAESWPAKEGGIDTSSASGSVSTAKRPFDAAFALQRIVSMLSSLGTLFTNAVLILLTVIFILLEASSFPRKLRGILKDPEKSLDQFDTFIDSVQKYMVLKTLISAATGVSLGVGLAIIGVDYAFLWGLLAFFFHYVPNIGSIIAAIPPILVAFVQLGTVESVVTAVLYLTVNMVLGNFIEPRVMGKGVGLSTLVVFISLVFWGWVLGPVGMLLSVPLTMTMKIALDSHESTKWLAILLDSDINQEGLQAERGQEI